MIDNQINTVQTLTDKLFRCLRSVRYVAAYIGSSSISLYTYIGASDICKDVLRMAKSGPDESIRYGDRHFSEI